MNRANRHLTSRRSRGPLQRQLPFGDATRPSTDGRTSSQDDLPANRLQAFGAGAFENDAIDLRSAPERAPLGEVVIDATPSPATRDLGPARPRGSERSVERRSNGRRGPFLRVALEAPASNSQPPAAPPPHRIGGIAAGGIATAAGPRGPLHVERVPAPQSPVLQLVGVAFTLATFMAAALWL